MQGIEFEEEKSLEITSRRVSIPSEKGILLELLTKLGINDLTTANYILFGTAVILISMTIFIYAGVLSDSEKNISLDSQAISIMNSSQ